MAKRQDRDIHTPALEKLLMVKKNEHMGEQDHKDARLVLMSILDFPKGVYSRTIRASFDNRREYFRKGEDSYARFETALYLLERNKIIQRGKDAKYYPHPKL